MSRTKKILLAPLDWGIGHATRCVPLIRLLQQKGAEVILAGSGRAASFLESEFQDLQHIRVPAYNIRYPQSRQMAVHMIRQSPAILRTISKEHRILEALISQFEIDAVISDNRFGMWSDRVPSIYITHQIMIKAPSGWSFTEKMMHSLHNRYIRRFEECWIPDFAEDGLSGDLAHKRSCPVPAYFIGPLSRFEFRSDPLPEKKYELMAIISGPEPQRSIFEEMILKQLKETSYKSLVLLGKPESEIGPEVFENIEVHAHMDTTQMQQAILSSRLIICRPGYSSLMDLSVLGSRAVFIPTPGQTEQEYLASYHLQKNHFYMQTQDEFDISNMLNLSENFQGIEVQNQYDNLNKRIDLLLSRL